MQRQSNTIVEIKDLAFSYDGKPVIENFNLSIHRGDSIAILGPSGSGKTTLLRLIAGMEAVQEGHISINAGVDETPISYMLQDYDAFPWMSIYKNLLLSGEKRRDVIMDTARQLGIDGLVDRYPRQLSGGQRKRVALARTLLAEPAFLIMDEPFSSLDVKTKFSIFSFIEKVYRDGHRASLFVSHAVEEALLIADRVLVLNGPPLRIVEDFRVEADHPRGKDFIGSDTFREAEARIMDTLLA